jgi:Fe-S cluster biogenesis protein NfuA
MNELRAEIDKLSDLKLAYVMARAQGTNDAHGYNTAGIAKTTFYKWSVEERDHLNEVAQRIKRETITRAIMTIQDAADEAAKVKVAGLKERDARVRQAAASEILDRTVGKAADKLDVTSQQIINILEEYVKPAVQGDGGNIMFDSFNADEKKVKVILQGACSGCPSSTFTLKNGIENMLRDMLNDNEIKVEAINA